MLATDTLGDTLKGKQDKKANPTALSIDVDSKEEVKRKKL